jgi:hypothetical protein
MNKPVNRAAAAVMHARAGEIVKRLPSGPCTWVEVGVWRGDNARRVMRSCHDGVRYIGVDPWRVVDSPEYRAYATKDALATQDAMDRYAAEALTKVQPWRKRCRLLRLSSVEAARDLAGQQFDLVFIDAEHTYDALTADIAAWLPLIKAGSWLGGHDYGKDRFPGVTQAVDELFAGRVELGSDSTWWVRV